MSFDLTRSDGAWLSLPNVYWSAALHLARLNGWQPRGTLAPDLGPEFEPCTNWDGGYGTNDFQRMTPEDAGSMARALEAALADVPRHDTRPPGDPWEAAPVELFSGPRRGFLERIVALLKGGSVAIG